MKLPDHRALAMQGEELLKQVQAVPITDLGSFEQISALGCAAKRLGQHVENLFEESVKASDKTHKGILALRKLAMSKFEECEALSKELVAKAWQSNRDWKADDVIFTQPWGFEVTDASLLPKQYLMPDEKKLRGIVSALGTEAEQSIPGIRVYPKVQVAFRVGNE